MIINKKKKEFVICCDRCTMVAIDPRIHEIFMWFTFAMYLSDQRIQYFTGLHYISTYDQINTSYVNMVFNIIIFLIFSIHKQNFSFTRGNIVYRISILRLVSL